MDINKQCIPRHDNCHASKCILVKSIIIETIWLNTAYATKMKISNRRPICVQFMGTKTESIHINNVFLPFVPRDNRLNAPFTYLM